jgi:hypothetical protein
MRHSALVAACLTVISLSTNLAAQTLDDIRTGARVRAEVPGPKKSRILTGQLVSRTPDTLQLRLDRSDEIVLVPVGQLRRLEVSREQHSGAGRGAKGGFLLGATMGLAAGFSCDCGEAGLAAVTLGALLGGLGTGLGALMGSGARVDEWTPVILPAAATSGEFQPGGIALLHLGF